MTEHAARALEVITVPSLTSSAGAGSSATLTVALESGALSVRAVDGTTLWGNPAPAACVWKALPVAAELNVELKEHRFYPDREREVSIACAGQPGALTVDLKKLADAPARGKADALVGLPGGVGGEMLVTLLRRRDDLRAALQQQSDANTAREAKRSATEASLQSAVEAVQRAEVDEYATCLPLLRAKQAKVDSLEKEAVGRCVALSSSDDDD